LGFSHYANDLHRRVKNRTPRLFLFQEMKNLTHGSFVCFVFLGYVKTLIYELGLHAINIPNKLQLVLCARDHFVLIGGGSE
jgi:hypothetical protein